MARMVKPKYLIVPDVHQSCRRMMSILDVYESQVDQIIFVGDYFDSFFWTIEDVQVMCDFLRRKLPISRYSFILGNHDAHYLFPQHHGRFACSGYNSHTQAIVKPMLTSMARLFKPWVWIDEQILVSHAGISNQWLKLFGIDTNDQTRARVHHVLHQLQELWENGADNECCNGLSPIEFMSAIGQARGGHQQIGGPLWADWHQEFKHVRGITQVLGHTTLTNGPEETPVDDLGCFSLNIDTGLNHVVIAEYSEDAHKYTLRYEKTPL